MMMKIVLVTFSFLWASQVNAFLATTTTPSMGVQKLHLAYRTVEQAIAEAEDICRVDGPHSEACRVAWDIVEELEATDSHYRSAPSTYSPLEAARGRNGYAGVNSYNNIPPSVDSDIATAKDVNALLQGFDILVSRLDTKLDRLIATTDRLMELGADDPAVDELGHRAEEMKRLMVYVQRYLDQH